MSKPLTEEVAREYGYTAEIFEEWLGNYFDSLKVEERANQIQPIKQNKYKVGMPLLTEEIKKYVLEIKKEKKGTYLTLNPNYIYIIRFGSPYGQKNIPYYIPTKKSFHFKNNPTYNRIEGVYNKGAMRRNNSFTNHGFDISKYEIIGILKFPSQIEFMNWKESPWEVKG
jgi:hypothetical protein